jgi:hypothetical protein
MTNNEDDKDNRIAELEKLVASLQKRLRTANDIIDLYQSESRKNYRLNNDYLPYEDDDRDR